MLIPVIGLEVHIELNTKSKMFCGCANKPFGEEPNTLTCPVCLGLPGALPVPNKAAVESTILLGLALEGTINENSFFERKNYFYPDLPKGYQISQYQKPLCIGGRFDVRNSKLDREVRNTEIRINRIHQEEDTAKLLHEGDKTLIDFNRSGVPLTELVTEADFRNAATAKQFLKELARLIRCLKISEADMEKGSMRLEANISVQEEGCFEVREAKVWPIGDYRLNPKVEVKNINSFRFVEKAINYEIKRQTDLINKGQKIVQETRGYNESTSQTYYQREKEEAHDYRYFPEPDIPPLRFGAEDVEKIRARLPELPSQKVARWVGQGVKPADAEVLVENEDLIKLFDLVAVAYKAPAVANLLVNRPEFRQKSVSEIIEYLETAVKKPQLAKEEITKICEQVVSENLKAVEDYRKGKEAGLKFLVGQVMRFSQGLANVSEVSTELKELLD